MPPVNAASGRLSMAQRVDSICERLHSDHGRCSRPAGWTKSLRGLRARIAARPAVVDADRRRGTALPDRRHARAGLADPENDEALLLRSGDVAVIRGPAPLVADDPATAPQVVILPGWRGHRTVGVQLMSFMGVRTWGNSPVGSTEMVTGTDLERVSRRAAAAARASRRRLGFPARRAAREEIVKDDPGQEAVLDRLLDLLLSPCCGRGSLGPMPGAGLVSRCKRSRRGQGAAADPRRPGSSLDGRRAGGRGGRPRAAFARRFTELVGEPPMKFLTDWRLSLAADLLEPEATIGSVAYQVGYGARSRSAPPSSGCADEPAAVQAGRGELSLRVVPGLTPQRQEQTDDRRGEATNAAGSALDPAEPSSAPRPNRAVTALEGSSGSGASSGDSAASRISCASARAPAGRRCTSSS